MHELRAIRRLWAQAPALVLLLSLTPGLASAQAASATVSTTKAAGTTAAPATKAAAPKTTKAAAPAAAEPPASDLGPSAEQQAQARTAFDAGKKAYDAGDFAGAEAEFKKAYDLVPVPHAEYWIASSIDKQNKDAASVVQAYELFLSNPGANHVGDDKVAEAKARVAELKKALPAKYTFTTATAGAEVQIDGGAQSGTTPYTVELTPGKHKVVVSQANHETNTAEIDVAGGSVVEHPVTLDPKAVEPEVVPPPAAPAATPRSKVPGYVTLGLGAAGLVSGVVFGILALDAKSQFDSHPTDAKADEVERNALIADMSFGVALTLGITGVVLLTSGDDVEKPATAKAGRFIVAPFASHTGGGAAAHLTF